MLNARNQTVNVKRLDVIDALTKGLADHQKSLSEATEDYNLAVVKFLEEALQNAKNGVFKNLVLNISKPEDHTKDYQHVLDMLEVSVDETIQLDSDTFRAFFKGEWSWKNRFLDIMASTKAYING